MSNGAAWERVEPATPCTSPDGHEFTDLLHGSSSIPALSRCPRCGGEWTIVVYATAGDTPTG